MPPKLNYLVPKLCLRTRQGRHEVVFRFTFSPFSLFPFSPGSIGLGAWKLTDMVDQKKFRGTTILMVRRGDKVAVAGDGQVTMGDMVMKHHAKKVRKLYHGKIIVGFAGSAADALTLFERLEAKLEKHQGNLTRSVVELAKDWRTDRILLRLEALLLAVDATGALLISGTGDVIEPD